MDGSDIGTQSGLRIGRVIAVSASQAVALLERCDDSGGTDRPWPVEMGALVKMHTRVSTVYGGTQDIQRNIIAERLWGLPR